MTKTSNFKTCFTLLFFTILINFSSITSATTIHKGKAYRFDRNGWIYLHIEGKPYERGFQYGYLIAKELQQAIKTTKYTNYWSYGRKWSYYVKQASDIFIPHIDKEYLQEIKGIAAGARAKGIKNISWKDVLTWNGISELTYYQPVKHKTKQHKNDNNTHCSAFIATGSSTSDGQIVMAHTTFDEYPDAQFQNIIIDIKPNKGHHILMQTMVGYIDSITDYFITDAGIMGEETTIDNIDKFNPQGIPEFVRMRKATQYANNLDEWVKIFSKGNNGADSASWLLGNWKSGEIMRFEMGLNHSQVVRKKDGYFAGFNAAIYPPIRYLDGGFKSGFLDIRSSMGARRLRFMQLFKKYNGKINLTIAKKILGDHYDVYLNKNQPSCRTIAGHCEMDPAQFPAETGGHLPYQPHGSTDVKITTSDLAKHMSFWAHWGSADEISFISKKFLERHGFVD